MDFLVHFGLNGPVGQPAYLKVENLGTTSDAYKKQIMALFVFL